MTRITRSVGTWLASLFALPVRNESGATAVEYGIMVALIAAIIIGVVTILGQDIRNAFCKVVEALGGGCGP
jgi:pilus assembly protein Flp/PilA